MARLRHSEGLKVWAMLPQIRGESGGWREQDEGIRKKEQPASWNQMSDFCYLPSDLLFANVCAIIKVTRSDRTKGGLSWKI